jgi:hypothetical protein
MVGSATHVSRTPRSKRDGPSQHASYRCFSTFNLPKHGETFYVGYEAVAAGQFHVHLVFNPISQRNLCQPHIRVFHAPSATADPPRFEAVEPLAQPGNISADTCSLKSYKKDINTVLERPPSPPTTRDDRNALQHQPAQRSIQVNATTKKSGDAVARLTRSFTGALRPPQYCLENTSSELSSDDDRPMARQGGQGLRLRAARPAGLHVRECEGPTASSAAGGGGTAGESNSASPGSKVRTNWATFPEGWFSLLLRVLHWAGFGFARCPRAVPTAFGNPH